MLVEQSSNITGSLGRTVQNGQSYPALFSLGFRSPVVTLDQ